MSSRPQNQPLSLLRSFRLLLVMVVNKDEVSDLIRTNNGQVTTSLKELLQDIVGQIKRANETSV